jgi:DNA-binding PadR family transcriptional regulator
MMKAHESRSGLRISTGSFYRELGKLLAAGLVRAAANPEGDDARRTPYSISPAGATVFDEWFVRRPGEPINSDDEIASRAIFLAETDPTVARQVMIRWGETLWLRSKVLERERKAALAEMSAKGAEFSTRALLVSRRLAHVAADIEFLEKLMSAYESWVASRPAARAESQGVAGEVRSKAARR